MHGKTVVLTGGTSGIGEVAAEALARMGARIVLVARDRDRAEAMLLRLRAAAPARDHVVHLADLSSVAECKRVGAAIAAAEPRIDVLVNNAGAMFWTFQKTSEGFERTFATNHLGYFVLTDALRDRLVAAAPSRVVMTASDAHRAASVDWADPQLTKNYGGFKAYCRSKLYNILFTRELARRLAGTGVTAQSQHPGLVATRFADNNGGLTRIGARIVKSLFAITPAEGARTMIYLASAPDVPDPPGHYFAKSAPANPTAIAQDDAAAARLWALSADLTGVGAGGG